MQALKENEKLVFVSVDVDILGNNTYTELNIYKVKEKLYLKFHKKAATKRVYHQEFLIEEIHSVLTGTKGETNIPNFISRDAKLEGIYEGGLKFCFEKIILFNITEMEGCANNEKNKRKN